MSSKNRSSTERPSAISSAKVQMEMGGFVVILPASTSANVARACQIWMKKELKNESDRLRKFGKTLDINKAKDKVTNERVIVVAVSQLKPHDPKKLVLDPDPYHHSGDRPTKFTRRELNQLSKAGLTLKTFDKIPPNQQLTNTWLPE